MVNHRGPLPLRELHSTSETMMWGDPGGSWACLPPVYDYEWNHTATCCHICRTCPQKQSAEYALKSSWEKRRDLQNAEKKKLVSSWIFTFRHPYRVTSGWIIHSQLLYTRAKTINHLNASLRKKKKRKKRKQPTILDITQSTANITSSSVYISLIYN